jgi:hypothetical protein
MVDTGFVTDESAAAPVGDLVDTWPMMPRPTPPSRRMGRPRWAARRARVAAAAPAASQASAIARERRPPCSYNATPASCTAQFGCAWPVDAGSGASCEVAASQCGSTREECLAAGCQYLNNDRYCAGKPTPCAQLSAANCTAQDGCILSGS